MSPGIPTAAAPESPRAGGRTRIGVALAAAGICLLAAVAWYWNIRTPRWDGPVRVGFRDAPPHYFVSPAGTPQGLAVDVVNEAAKRVGLPVSWVLVEDSSLRAIEDGRIDVWATMPVDRERDDLRVTDPWLQGDFFLVFRQGMPVTDVGDLSGRRVAVLSRVGGGEEELARGYVPGAQLVPAPSSAGKLVRVCAGEADAALVGGREILSALLARPPGCEPVQFAFLPVPGSTLLHGLGSTRAAEAVANRLRAEIDEMAADGVLAEIHGRWSFATATEVRMVDALRQARFRNRLFVAGVLGLTLALLVALWEVVRSRKGRRLAEDHARQQERYRVLFERNLAGVFRSRADGVILDCNDAFARMLGCQSPEDVLKRQAWEFYPDRESREAALRHLGRERTITNQEIVIRRADGTLATLLESASVIESGGGQPDIYEGTVIDITRQRELEEQYRQAQKLESIGRLAGGVAHDFNNTLTAINGYAELAVAGLEPSDPALGMVQEIQKAAQHAEHLTRQLLAFSRRQQLKPRVISLNEVVADTLDLLKRLIGEDVTLTTALAPDLGRVKADPSQIHQVLMNLAVNARDAMPSGGRLTIGTANVALGAQAENEPSLTAGAYVRLTVSDTGDGMDADTQLHVFEPFFTTKEHGKGTGLGLSTVYGIVKQSGGFIRVRSQPGAGSTFTIDLPAIAEAASEPDPVKRTEGLRGTETILVVEDQDDVRNLVAAALRRYGYTVMDASQGEAAVEICRRETRPIHLLIADVVMPGMTGPAVARACRAEQPGLSVLYISGYAEHILRREAGDLPPGSYLQKPFSPAQLAARVRELLDSRSGSAPA